MALMSQMVGPFLVGGGALESPQFTQAWCPAETQAQEGARKAWCPAETQEGAGKVSFTSLPPPRACCTEPFPGQLPPLLARPLWRARRLGCPRPGPFLGTEMSICHASPCHFPGGQAFEKKGTDAFKGTKMVVFLKNNKRTLCISRPFWKP